MEIQKLVCPACGAPLSVEKTTAQITCDYCRTPLAVQRPASSSMEASGRAGTPTVLVRPAAPATTKPLSLPGEAVAPMTWWRLLFLFDGRITRAQFWIGAAVAVGLLMLANLLSGRHVNPVTGETVLEGNFMTGLLMLTGLWVLAASSIKRLRDRGKAGWWVLLYLVPFGIFWLLIDLGLLPGKATRRNAARANGIPSASSR